MKTDATVEQRIPLSDFWDVLVVGGGPAGCAAAASAAQAGAKTLLLDSSGALGGMGTGGLVPTWCPFSDGEKIIYRGIAQKVFEACKAGMPHVDPKAMDWVPIDPERLKRVYDDLVLESGAKVLFHTFACGVNTDGKGNITSVVAGNKSGLTAYRAKVYVDCTGDADLAAWAGAEFLKGDDVSGELQKSTLCFILTNVDEYAYRHGPELHTGNPKSPIYEILKSGEYPEIADAHLCHSLIGPGTVGFNAGHLAGVDATDPVSVSEAMAKGRKIAAAFRKALAEFHPEAFSNAFLVETGALMGIRESRRVMGDYVLDIEDYLEKRSFEDEICRCSYYIDVHGTVGRGNESPAKKYPRYGKGESFGIPYRCLVPRKLKNVLVAGRSISSTRPVQGSVRVMPVCLATGQAAGEAAALGAWADKPDLHGVDVKLLQAKLKENGAFLP